MCTPSRASLITGRYAVRSGMASSTSRVMRSPGQYGGLPHSEITLAEVFGNAGYRTALVGVSDSLHVLQLVSEALTALASAYPLG